MSRPTVFGLRKRARLLRLGSWFALSSMGVLTGAAWWVDGHLVGDCAMGAFFMGLFFYGFFTASTDLYTQAARLQRRNTELMRIRGFYDQE